MKRRTFLRRAAGLAAGATILPLGCAKQPGAAETAAPVADPIFRISLAQWSLHRAIRGGALDPLDFPVVARRDYGLDAVEYVNQLFTDRRTDPEYLGELKARCDGEGVRSLLIMCDGLGELGDADEAARLKAVENHRPWIDAAVFLGCHSIRVNAQSSGSREEQTARAADGLRRLAEIGEASGINVIVENHGGLSSDGSWLAGVMRAVDHPRIGTLPDFGNFNLGDGTSYDRYLGISELMPFAKGVSAKSHDFDAEGNEIHTDYDRMLRIVLDSGYRGYIDVEYEGNTLSEPDGIRATIALLGRVREKLAPEYS